MLLLLWLWTILAEVTILDKAVVVLIHKTPWWWLWVFILCLIRAITVSTKWATSSSAVVGRRNSGIIKVTALHFLVLRLIKSIGLLELVRRQHSVWVYHWFIQDHSLAVIKAWVLKHITVHHFSSSGRLLLIFQLLLSFLLFAALEVSLFLQSEWPAYQLFLDTNRIRTQWLAYPIGFGINKEQDSLGKFLFEVLPNFDSLQDLVIYFISNDLNVSGRILKGFEPNLILNLLLLLNLLKEGWEHIDISLNLVLSFLRLLLILILLRCLGTNRSWSRAHHWDVEGRVIASSIDRLLFSILRNILLLKVRRKRLSNVLILVWLRHSLLHVTRRGRLSWVILNHSLNRWTLRLNLNLWSRVERLGIMKILKVVRHY